MLIKKSEQQSIKIGILLPQSRQYPKAALSFLNGVKLYFTIHENKFERGKAELIVEGVGLGTERIAIEKAHKLIVQDQVTAVTGLLRPLVALDVGKIIDMAGIPALFSSLGESTIQPGSVPKNLYFNTLQYWQSSFLLGQYIAQNYNNPISIVTSFYDCGYDHLNAFRLGVKSVHGQLANEIILKSESLEELKVEVDNHLDFNNDTLFSLLFHPTLLSHFIDHYGERLDKMVVTPFYEGENKTTKYWAAPEWKNNGILSVIFQEAVSDYFGESADIFNLLGYQHGNLIYKALAGLSDPDKDSENIIKSWANFNDDLVVGRSSFNTMDHTLNSPISVFSGLNTLNYKTQKVLSTDLINDVFIDELFEIRNSFTNPYMFF